ncbi:MAG TPA: amidohydrolase family protein [Burkholderiales bacterium]|nr:amidohydrolase family protein [Burkholderiales bacterium]
MKIDMPSRREFLKGALGAGLALGVPGTGTAEAQTLAQGAGTRPQSARQRTIVDAQVHLWLAEGPDRPWPPGGAAAAHLPYPFTTEKLLPLMNEAGVDRVVIVPPSWEGERNDYALLAAKNHPDRFAVMGRVLLDQPQSAALLPKWKQQPGMLGIRLTFNRAQTRWLSDGTAEWLWPAAAKAGAPIMISIAGRQEEFARVAERNPDTIFIIDHMALSDDIAKAGKTGEAIAATAALARFPNVSCKMSSAANRSQGSYPFDDMKPHLRRIFEAFGPRRSYWGTDITADLSKATYRQRITHFTETLDFLTEEDKDWVMGRAILTRLNWS